MNFKHPKKQKAYAAVQKLRLSLLALLTTVVTAVPASAKLNSQNHPDWYDFYDGAQKWHIFSITRELGQLICVILDKLLDFFEDDVFNTIFSNGGKFLDNITRKAAFGGGFTALLIAFLIVGLVSYGVWILLHSEQTSNTGRYLARQLIAVVLCVALIPAGMHYFWDLIATGTGMPGKASVKKATTGTTDQTIKKNKWEPVFGDSLQNSASAQCMTDNITDWYWMAGKGAIYASKDSSDSQKDQNKAEQNSKADEKAENVSGGDWGNGGSNKNYKDRGKINWEHARGETSGKYYTCDPWLGALGWEMIDPSQYMTLTGMTKYNKQVEPKAIQEQIKALQAEKGSKGTPLYQEKSTEGRRCFAQIKYYKNLGDTTTKSKENGTIPENVAADVYTRTDTFQVIEAATGGSSGDNPAIALLKNGLGEAPYYRYTINFLPMIIELAALAVFYFMVSLKVLRILFDTIIAGIVGPLFVAADFWGESSQKTKVVYRSIINGYLSIAALLFEVEMFELFCSEISYMDLGVGWFASGFVKAMMYMALCFIGVKGADIFKKLNLDVDNSASLQAGKAMAKAGGRAAHATARAINGAAGLMLGSTLTGMAKPLAGLNGGNGGNGRDGSGGRKLGLLGSGKEGENGAGRRRRNPLDRVGAGVDEAEQGALGKEKNKKEQSAISNGKKSNSSNDRKNAIQNSDAHNKAEGLKDKNDSMIGNGSLAGARKENALKDGQNGQNGVCGLNGKKQSKDEKALANGGQNAQNMQDAQKGKADAAVLGKGSPEEADGGKAANTAGKNGSGTPGTELNQDQNPGTLGEENDAALGGENDAALSEKSNDVNALGITPEDGTDETDAIEAGGSDDSSMDESASTALGQNTGVDADNAEELSGSSSTEDTTASTALNNGQPANNTDVDTEGTEGTSGVIGTTGFVPGVPGSEDGNTSLGESDSNTALTQNGVSPETGTDSTGKPDTVGSGKAAGEVPENASAAPMGEVPGTSPEAAPITPASTTDSSLQTPASEQQIPGSGSTGSTMNQTEGAGNGAPLNRETNSGDASRIHANMGENGSVNINAGDDAGITVNTTQNGSGETNERRNPNSALSSTSNAGGGGSHSEPTEISSSSSSGDYNVGGYRSKHSSGQAAKMEAKYAGKGALGQATANAYGHEMAAMNNIATTVGIARHNRAANAYVGEDGKARVHHVRAAAQTVHDVAAGAVNAKRTEYDNYLKGGFDRIDGKRGDSRGSNEERFNIDQIQDNRTKNTMDNESRGN